MGSYNKKKKYAKSPAKVNKKIQIYIVRIVFNEYSTDVVVKKLAPAANSQRNEMDLKTLKLDSTEVARATVLELLVVHARKTRGKIMCAKL